MKNCIKCRHPLFDDAVFCSNCGATQRQKNYCPHCGAPATGPVCADCGLNTGLDDPAAVPSEHISDQEAPQDRQSAVIPPVIPPPIEPSEEPADTTLEPSERIPAKPDYSAAKLEAAKDLVRARMEETQRRRNTILISTVSGVAVLAIIIALIAGSGFRRDDTASASPSPSPDASPIVSVEPTDAISPTDTADAPVVITQAPTPTPTPSPTPTPTPTPSPTPYSPNLPFDIEGMLLPNSDTILLMAEDVESAASGYDKDEFLKFAVYEIFARHGHDFGGRITEFYNKYSWYRALPKTTISETDLSETERANLQLLYSLS
ncbi:MAG: YARHG domain-containing protein [Christensenellales bacterium]|jgi:hypothetical protein